MIVQIVEGQMVDTIQNVMCNRLLQAIFSESKIGQSFIYLVKSHTF